MKKLFCLALVLGAVGTTASAQSHEQVRTQLDAVQARLGKHAETFHNYFVAGGSFRDTDGHVGNALEAECYQDAEIIKMDETLISILEAVNLDDQRKIRPFIAERLKDFAKLAAFSVEAVDALSQGSNTPALAKEAAEFREELKILVRILRSQEKAL